MTEKDVPPCAKSQSIASSVDPDEPPAESTGEGCYLWRIRGPWSNDDWLLASDIPAAEMESRNKCEVSIISFRAT